MFRCLGFRVKGLGLRGLGLRGLGFRVKGRPRRAHSTQHTAHSTQHTAHSTQHTTHNTKCATATALGGTEHAFRLAEQEKQRRYKGHAYALSVELRGGIASAGRSLLEQLSWEAAIAKPSNGSPTRLMRQWCRELELVLAFEAADALRAVHGNS